jgi:hypothetical protein
LITIESKVDSFEKVLNEHCGDIRSLRESRAELQGKANQSTAVLAIVLSIAGLVIGAAAILLKSVGG